jgi:hypothetical protein
MRVLALFALLLAACSAAGSSGAEATATPPSASESSQTLRPAATPVTGCEPTRARDADGVITSNDRIGIVGETFAFGDLMNGSIQVVRRAAIPGDQMSVRFDQIGNTAPAKWVSYGVGAQALVTPWGNAAFPIGWKPIAFEDSCWRLIVDGADTGIVLAVGH